MQFVYGFAIESEIAFMPGTVEGQNVFNARARLFITVVHIFVLMALSSRRVCSCKRTVHFW